MSIPPDKPDETGPDKQAGTGDDRGENGQFAKGRSGNRGGRPKALDFRKLVEEKARETGFDLDKATWEVFMALHDEALNGSGSSEVAAGKLWLDRRHGLQRQEVGVETNYTGPTGPTLPTGQEWRDWVRKLGEVVEEEDQRNADLAAKHNGRTA